jgi:hypothetical protein
MNAFCASVNFDAFIVLHSSQPGKSEQKTLTQNDPVFGEQSSLVLTNTASLEALFVPI